MLMGPSWVLRPLSPVEPAAGVHILETRAQSFRRAGGGPGLGIGFKGLNPLPLSGRPRCAVVMEAWQECTSI